MTQVFQGDNALAVTLVEVESQEMASSLVPGAEVTVVGTTKGKGFQGVVKRHGFGGGPKTHGQKNRYRAPGSIGNTAAQRVLPGRRMAGRMGGDRQTIKGIEVIDVKALERIVTLKGPIPGNNGGIVNIIRTDEMGDNNVEKS